MALTRVLQWNMLAQGLSDDGFIVPLLESEEKNKVPKRINRFLFDSASPSGIKTTALVPISEFITDTKVFTEAVIPSIRKSLKQVFGDKYKDKVHFKAIGQYVALEGNKKVFNEVMAGLNLNVRDQTEFVRIRDSYDEAIKLFDRKWDLATHRENLRNFMSWDNRGDRIVSKIINENPDIITMQEVDRYGFLRERLKSKYSSGLAPQDEPYAKAHFDYNGHLNSRKHAFVPKLNSSCRRFAKDKDNAEDDGSVIFWRKDRYECVSIHYHYFFEKNIFSDAKKIPKKSKGGGAVAVHLKDVVANSDLWVFSTHLESGDKEVNENARVEQVEIFINFMEKCLGNSASCPVIVGMDGNSYRGYNTGDYGKKGVRNMYEKLHTMTKDRGFELKNYLHSIGADEKVKKKLVSVNKIRGVLTAQPYKIGEYQSNNIDYVLCSAQNMHFQMPEKHEAGHLKRYATREEAYDEILPNLDVPSDHLPVIVDIEYGFHHRASIDETKSYLEKKFNHK